MPSLRTFQPMRTSILLAGLALVACSKTQPPPAAKTNLVTVTGPVCDSLACADRNRIQGQIGRAHV